MIAILEVALREDLAELFQILESMGTVVNVESVRGRTFSYEFLVRQLGALERLIEESTLIASAVLPRLDSDAPPRSMRGGGYTRYLEDLDNDPGRQYRLSGTPSEAVRNRRWLADVLVPLALRELRERQESQP